MAVMTEDWLEALNREIERRERIERCENDFAAFCQEYWGDTFLMEDVTPAFHDDLRALATREEEFEEWFYTDPVTGNKRKKRGLILAAPRGHAKTMVLTFMLTCWWVCYKKKKFIILIGASADASTQNVNDIRMELEGNEKLKSDFGDLAGNKFGMRWAQSDFVAVHTDPETKKITHTCRVLAKSPGAMIRGTKNRGARPDAIIVDDLEDDESVRNALTIQKTHNWLNKAAIPALTPKKSHFVMIGTILHYDSVLARMLDPKFKDVYVQRVYRAYWDENGERKYLWPERFSQEMLDFERRRVGSLAFNSEYLNNPIDPETRRFRPEWMGWYRGSDIEFKRGRWWYKDQPLKILQAVDPSIRDKDQDNNDFFAHITIGVTEESDVTKRTIIVFWPYKDRLDFPQQVQRVIQQANVYRGTVERIGIESVAYQAALRQQILLREALPLYPIKHDRGQGEKKARITAMSVFFENGQILLRAAEDSEAGELDELQQVRVHYQFKDLYEDLMRYPLISHDDLLDTLEMCIGMAKKSAAFADFAPEPVDDRTSVFGEVGDGPEFGEIKAPFLDSNNQPLPFMAGEDRVYRGW